MKENNFKSLVSISLILVVLLFNSCNRHKQDPQPQSVSNYSWIGQLSSNTSDTVVVKDGYLYLSTSNSGNGAFVGSANSLEGDFLLHVNFSNVNFKSVSYFSEILSISLDAPDHNGTSLRINAALSGQTIQIQDTSAFANPSAQKSISSPLAGEFFAKRTGNTITAWIRTGSDTVSIIKSNYTSEPMHLNLGVYTNNSSVNRSSVNIDEVIVSGGGNKLVTDIFDSNTIGFE